MNNIEEFLKALNNESKTKAYDSNAEVMRIEGDKAWVHLPGGIPETPVELNISAKPGDKVKVRVANGRAYLIGNRTAPPTDDAVAKKTNSKVNNIIQNKLPELNQNLIYVQTLLDKYAAHIDIGIDDNGNPFISLYSEINKNKVNITNKGIVIEANSGVVNIDSVGLVSQTLNTQILNLPKWQITGSHELKIFSK